MVNQERNNDQVSQAKPKKETTKLAGLKQKLNKITQVNLKSEEAEKASNEPQDNLNWKDAKPNSNLLLDVQDLWISFKKGRNRLINIIRGVDISVDKAQIVGLVGESGSGKSVSSKSLLNINEGAIVSAKKMSLANLDMLPLLKTKRDSQWSKIRGHQIGYIPQDPLTSLNPTRKIGKQLLDAIKHDNRFKTKKEKTDYLINLLKSFGIRDAEKRFYSYPHALSGGQKQRIVIAMVVAMRPKLIIADEPTTALDPTVQASVLALFEQIRKDFNISIIFISHNISVVAKFCDYIYVMYAGRIVEKAPKNVLFTNPRHPYTWALLQSIPEDKEKSLYNIKGTPPDMTNLHVGDPFAPRNDYAMAIDFKKEAPLFKVASKHYAATWLLHPDAPQVDIPEKLKERLEVLKKVFQ
ncbi:ABC transporter ATP-binding protein [Mycoplasmopsis agassizii]|uniref:ABC transporter ATP-binding protein n=1 Tax=Mycoplasmopsis agassizii TaxID=33922 RepID=UPI0035298D3E